MTAAQRPLGCRQARARGAQQGADRAPASVASRRAQPARQQRPVERALLRLSDRVQAVVAAYETGLVRAGAASGDGAEKPAR